MSRSRGTAREREVRGLLRERGWTVYRAGGSKGCADLVALKAGYPPRLVQVKSTARGGPFQAFGPADRAEIRAEAISAGAEAILVWWPPRRGPRFIPEKDWPV